jgi:hypothetical protein
LTLRDNQSSTKLLCATIIAAIITSPRHRLAILIAARFPPRLSRYTQRRCRACTRGGGASARRNVWPRPESNGEKSALRSMDKTIAYAISVLIIVFGVGILVTGLSSSSPVLWTCVAIIPIAIGLLSAFGDC